VAAKDASHANTLAQQLGPRARAASFEDAITGAEPATSGWAALTTSELTVARLVAEGLTNREVAERLFVSPHTVNSHLRHVFSKLAINSRVEPRDVRAITRWRNRAMSRPRDRDNLDTAG
jgi:DNA-binding CsgD family transcriptional regulator